MRTLSQARDAFQQRLLTYLYRGSESSSLVLKGGAAMRVLTEKGILISAYSPIPKEIVDRCGSGRAGFFLSGSKYCAAG